METIDLGGPSVVDRIGYRLLAGLDQREFIEYLFLNTLVIAYGRAKEINALYATVNKMESIFNRYSKLMQCVEEDNFQSEELKEISGQLANEKELASHAIKRLSSYIGGLDQRFSLAGIIFNLFYLRDTRHAILLERWIQTYSA